jgi:hypothetical protein
MKRVSDSRARSSHARRRPFGRAVVSAALASGMGLVGLVTQPAGAAASGALTSGALAPTNHGPAKALDLHSGSFDSVNWAGYAIAPGGDVTAVDSTWTVPSAGMVSPGFSTTWAGIGGYSTSDLIQAGVGEQSNPTIGSQYYAWYEILPGSEMQIGGCSGDPNCTVHPGDSVAVDIHLVAGTIWSVNLDDAGHWSYSTLLQYTSSESSAEWMQEAPTVGTGQTVPAPVGTVHFGPTSTYTYGDSTRTIASGAPTVINESSSGTDNLATTSPLASDGQSFDVCVYAQVCATP